MPGWERASDLQELSREVGLAGKRAGLAGAWLVHRLTGHTDAVTSVAICPDSGSAVSASADGSLRVWHLETGRSGMPLTGHQSTVSSVSIHPDGDWALSGSWDKTLRLWDLSTGRCVREFGTHTDQVRSVQISPDGRWGLSGDRAGVILLWSLSTGQCLRAFEGHPGGVNSVCISPDGRWALTGGNDALVALWDIASGQCLRTFAGHGDGRRGGGNVTSVDISSDGQWGLSASDDETLRLWDLATGACRARFEAHWGGFTGVCFAPIGRWAFSVSACGSNSPWLWELMTGDVWRPDEPPTVATCVTNSPDGRWVLSGDRDGVLHLWELDWEYAFPGAVDWDEGLRRYLEIFLTLHCPYDADGLSRTGEPSWDDHDFESLLEELQHRDLGWIRPEEVRRQLEKMTGCWDGTLPV